MKVTVVLIVLGALGAAPKILEKRLNKLEFRRRTETIQILVLLKLGGIHRKVLEGLEDFL